MRYIGNKTKLLPFLEEVIMEDFNHSLEDLIFCDLFAGTCTVGKHFKEKVKFVISNDLENYSFILAKNYIENDAPPAGYVAIIEAMNNLPAKSGQLSHAFSMEGEMKRKFFTVENARKIQAIREEIENFKSNTNIYNFLLCSLIESADIVANTTGVYGAFLKKFNERSKQDFVLRPFIAPPGDGLALRGYAEEVVENLEGDILYLDPPYNSRQYSSNYHILNCIIEYDNFSIKKNKKGLESKTALIEEAKTSSFSRKREARAALVKLLESSKGFRNIYLSYNDEGILSLGEIKEIMSALGEYSVVDKEHKRYKSNNSTSDKPVKEYIHTLKWGNK